MCCQLLCFYATVLSTNKDDDDDDDDDDDTLHGDCANETALTSPCA